MILYILKQDLASCWKVHSRCLHTTIKMIKKKVFFFLKTLNFKLKGEFVTGKKRRA